MENLKELADRADKILKEELKKDGIGYDIAGIRIYNAKSVGVQGDDRTYAYPAEIKLINDRKFIWKDDNEFYDFIARLSTRITNEIREINRVTYLIGKKE